MGQPLPLPNKIPMPTYEQKKSLTDMRIFVVGRTETIDDLLFVNYILPSKWKIVDDSWKVEHPIFYIIDNDNFVRVRICGSWNGAEKNYLNITINDNSMPLQKHVIWNDEIENTKELSFTSEKWVNDMINSEIFDIIKDCA
jgi:hypothetical protein